MGVPAFYRWLSQKYPRIVVDAVEEKMQIVGGEAIPNSAMTPNPNGVEYDNLYIDMNGIIHPCAHPEEGPQPTCEEEMHVNIMKYVDRLFACVRPRNLLYLAIDGVAPRAKMNQQRSRRFRTAQEAREKRELELQARKELAQLGHHVPPDDHDEAWDSNVITPGTLFMAKLSEYLRFYIHDRQNRDPAWQQIKVVLSDASVPGEGEHKIMSFIRQQRAMPGYNAATRHVLHGLDADLIMLGLATHETYFSILREQVLFGRAAKEAREQKDKRKAVEEELMERGGGVHDDSAWTVEKRAAQAEVFSKPLQFLHIAVLREYLEHEFKECARVPFRYDFDRVIDDVVFLCFFVGNDFLPHLPSLDIRDGALEFLFDVYKRVLPSLGSYICDAGEVNLSHVDIILAEVGLVEDRVFAKKREKDEMMRLRGEKQRAMKKRGGQDKLAAERAKLDAVAVNSKKSNVNGGEGGGAGGGDMEVVEHDTPGTRKALKARIKEMEEAALEEARGSVEDVVRLGEPGWKSRYYSDKYKSDDIAHGGGREDLFKAYIEGLCWVMLYYYRGVASWKWFYPFHYAPFASDLVNVDRFEDDVLKV
jgi:5'-3' exoribonuclease 2